MTLLRRLASLALRGWHTWRAERCRRQEVRTALRLILAERDRHAKLAAILASPLRLRHRRRAMDLTHIALKLETTL